jgi:hypothetical protein
MSSINRCLSGVIGDPLDEIRLREITASSLEDASPSPPQNTNNRPLLKPLCWKSREAG